MSADFTQIDFSNSGKDLLSAFVKFSADVGNVTKNTTNPHFKSSYADLSSAMNASREHLAKHELSIMQHPFFTGAEIGVTTLLIHSSGQFLSSTFLMKPVKTDPQALGSAVTYARRYAYMAILGMAAEDDDGNAASSQPKQSSSSTKHYADSAAVKRNDENFNVDNLEHMDRLENQLTRSLVPKNLWNDIASDLNGKPMVATTLKASIEKVCGAGYMESKIGESA